MLLDMVNTGVGFVHPELPMLKHERATIEPPLLRYAEDNPEFFVRAGGAAMPVTLLLGLGMWVKRGYGVMRAAPPEQPAPIAYTAYHDPAATEPSDIPDGARVTDYAPQEPLQSEMMRYASAITSREG